MNFDELAKRPGAKMVPSEPAHPLSFDELAAHPRAKVLTTAPEPEPAPDVSGWESAGRGGLQGATFGFGDEATGAMSSGLQALANALPQSVRDKLDLVQAPAGDAYAYSRDLERERNRAAEEAHRGLYVGGEVAGGLLTGKLVPGVSAAKGAGLTGKMGAAALTGIGQGAAYGAGMSDADLTKGDVGGLAWDATKGGAFGGLLGAAGAAAGHGLGKASNYFAGKATDAADRGLAQARERVAERIQEAAGSYGGESQKGMRMDEQFLRYLDDPNASPALRDAMRAWRDSPEGQAAIEQMLRNNLERAPGQAAQIASKKAALEALQEGKDVAIDEEAKRILSPLGALKDQVLPRLKRYGINAVGAGVGAAVGGPFGAAHGGAIGQLARPMLHSAGRMFSSPGIAKMGYGALEGVTGGVSRALSGASAAGTPLERDVFHSIADTVRENPQALGAFANYFKPDAPDEDNQLTAYVLTRTNPKFADHMRKLSGEPPGE